MIHDVLAPAGPQAAHIAQYWWVMLAVCTFVFVAMMPASPSSSATSATSSISPSAMSGEILTKMGTEAGDEVMR